MGISLTVNSEGINSGTGLAETTAATVAHNGKMGQSGQAAGQSEERLISAENTPLPEGTELASTMANNLHISNSDSQGAAALGDPRLDAFLGKAFEEKPIWVGLYESLRDVFFPVKLPPLELTSKPIPVPDRMAVKANPWAIGFSTSINVLILLALLFLGVKTYIDHKAAAAVTPIDVNFDLKAPKLGTSAGGGGGGGNQSIVDPIKGHLPPKMKDPITPPDQPVDKPKLAAQPAIDVQQNITLPDNPTLPNIGVKNSANVTLATGGQGSNGGMGSGRGGGMGSGTGDGYGPGYGGNTGGGLYRIGGGVSAPVPLNSVEAEFSDEARRAKYQGVCIVSLIVDAQGNPQNPRVVRALGMGLDEKALEAVRKYKFKPAMKDGKTPVPVMISVEVNFRLY
jgi:TonB family protein